MILKKLLVGHMGTCCYLLWRENRDDCVVIDPGARASAIRKAAGDRHIAAILLTHGHFDHIGAVKELMEKGTRLVAHRLEKNMPGDPHLNVSDLTGIPFVAPTPDLLVEEGDRIVLADIPFQVLHTPGHTPGSVCYLSEGNLFTGDTVFTHGWGRTDFPGGSEKDLQASLLRLYPLCRRYTMHPGHE
ncbi:MAG: MBL fold metallo-hydrolase [Clostridiales bacterium]|nr:MBL fold metallo-hydrolase [Clostridiales bacterium]